MYLLKSLPFPLSITFNNETENEFWDWEVNILSYQTENRCEYHPAPPEPRVNTKSNHILHIVIETFTTCRKTDRIGSVYTRYQDNGNAHIIKGNVDCGIALPPNLS